MGGWVGSFQVRVCPVVVGIIPRLLSFSICWVNSRSVLVQKTSIGGRPLICTVPFPDSTTCISWSIGFSKDCLDIAYYMTFLDQNEVWVDD